MDASFETFFDVCATRRGASYSEARSEILNQVSRSEAQALRQVRAAAQTPPGDWQRQLASDVIQGWVAHRTAYLRVAPLARGELPPPPPLEGFGSQDRAKAIAALGPAVVPRVIEMTWKTAEFADDTQMAALFGALGLLKDPRAVMPMVDIVQGADADKLKIEAISVLAAIGDPRGLQAILAVAKNRQASLQLRRTAIRALGAFDDPRARDMLLTTLKRRDLPAPERHAAAQGLANRGDPATAGAILEELKETGDPSIRSTLLRAMSRVGSRADIPALQEVGRVGDEEWKQQVRQTVMEISNRP